MIKKIILAIAITTTLFFVGCSDKDVKPKENQETHTPTLSSQKTENTIIKDMILIPEGEFIMGNDMVDTSNSRASFLLKKKKYMDEKPKRSVFTNAFYIAKYEVTNADYKIFTNANNYQPFPEHWENGTYPDGRADHPITYTNWFDAVAYSRSVKKRLPTEIEWEKAARGTDGRLWTWGNEFDPAKGNFGLNNIKDTMPVGSFIMDQSPFGMFDVAGNVKEWTSDWYKPYPGSDFEFSNFGEKHRVVRGSSHIKHGHYYDKSFAMVTHRFSLDPRYATGDVGIRLALTP